MSPVAGGAADTPVGTPAHALRTRRRTRSDSDRRGSCLPPTRWDPSRTWRTWRVLGDPFRAWSDGDR